jgi:LysM repeat protein
MIDRDTCQAWSFVAMGSLLLLASLAVGCKSSSRTEINRQSALDREPTPAYPEVGDRETVVTPLTFDDPITEVSPSDAQPFVEQRQPTIITLGEPSPSPAPRPAPAPRVTPRPAPAAPAAASRTHTIAKGDTLSQIAQQYYGTARRWPDIVAANPGLDPVRLYVGEEITIPNAGSAAAAAAAPRGSAGSTDAATAGRSHTIAAGDTLSQISQRYYGTARRWQEIVDANPGTDPAKLHVGKTLVIP